MADHGRDSSDTLVLSGSQYMLAGFPVLGLPDQVRAVKYFSLNPFLPDDQHRCPLECAYCVCHQDASWHLRPDTFAQRSAPHGLTGQLLDHIFATVEGRNGFPISLCDYSDPFLPIHRDRVLDIVQQLINRRAANLLYITTKIHPGMRFLRQLRETLAQPHMLRPTVFVSLPPLKPGYEHVSIPNRVRLLKDLVALGIPCCWYMRPLVEEWYDEELLWKLARELVPHVSHHVVLSSIAMSAEVEEVLRSRSLVIPAWDVNQPGRKRLLSPDFEQHVRQVLGSVAEELSVPIGPVMGHRLCGTNGNHAYGCLLCAKQDRYCQLFQVQKYGTTIDVVDTQRLTQVLREQMEIGLAPPREIAVAQAPSEQECL